jgi:hypothetical protein
MNYFDLSAAAKSARVGSADLERLRELMQREFPDDLMMQELHVLRACMAIAQGRLTLADALRPLAGAAA